MYLRKIRKKQWSKKRRCMYVTFIMDSILSALLKWKNSCELKNNYVINTCALFTLSFMVQSIFKVKFRIFCAHLLFLFESDYLCSEVPMSLYNLSHFVYLLKISLKKRNLMFITFILLLDIALKKNNYQKLILRL